MLTAEAIAQRRLLVEASADLERLLDHVADRANRVMQAMPFVPQCKASLSKNGGRCPDDGSTLEFDPWSPQRHRCPRCQRIFEVDLHHAHWARAQHLWLAERAAHLAALFALNGREQFAARARDLLRAYYELYHKIPNRDNVLGPSHLFFSTYLESIWITNYLCGAFLLRELDALTESDIEGVNAIADEAATLIGEFNEGMSNRQTWNAAALTAIAVWFGDEELAQNAVESRTGLAGHLADGFGSDGMWWEGDNYHLFAMRGLLVGMQWAAAAGADLIEDHQVAEHFAAAVMAPSLTALPDFTFAARKDARFGVSLAHPAYLESWEAARSMLGERAPASITSWLAALYQVPAVPSETFDSWLNDAGFPLPSRYSRGDLSWWALLTMPATFPDDAPEWQPTPALLREQGVAVLRPSRGYLAIEAGSGLTTGHGHPDRLHLTEHRNGVHWLADPGTGSYVSRDLFWYRSTMAHNAPLIDGVDQPGGLASRINYFDQQGEWGWIAATWDMVDRTVVAGRRWTLDVTTLHSPNPAEIALPFHLEGELRWPEDLSWEQKPDVGEFVRDVECATMGGSSKFTFTAVAGGRTVAVHLLGHGEVCRATAPGLPNANQRRHFVLRRGSGTTVRFVTLLDHAGEVREIVDLGHAIQVAESGNTDIEFIANGLRIAGSETVTLGGAQPPAPRPPLEFMDSRPPVARGAAILLHAEPPLDGTIAGFDRSAPLFLSEEFQYFRSETPYPGRESFAARAWINWMPDALYLAIEVRKSPLLFRASDAPPLELDNEADDIHSDGMQIHMRRPDGTVAGWLIRPQPDARSLVARALQPEPAGSVTGAWAPTQRGYMVTARIAVPQLDSLRRGEALPFDLIVNEMQPDRIRRAGQLIWSGGPGWVYLRGDRHDPANFGELELVG